MKPSDIEKNWKKDLEKRGVLKQSKNIFWVVYRKGLFICFSKNKTDAMEEYFKNNGIEVVKEEYPANPVAPQQGNVDKARNEALEAIRTLAKTKKLVKSTMPVAEIDATIEAFTGLSMKDEASFTKIIIALTSYNGK